MTHPNNIHLWAPMGHGYTQIVSKMGFTHGQLQIGSETLFLLRDTIEQNVHDVNPQSHTLRIRI